MATVIKTNISLPRMGAGASAELGEESWHSNLYNLVPKLQAFQELHRSQRGSSQCATLHFEVLRPGRYQWQGALQTPAPMPH